jgi:hypothetical protein
VVVAATTLPTPTAPDQVHRLDAHALPNLDVGHPGADRRDDPGQLVSGPSWSGHLAAPRIGAAIRVKI